MSTASAWDAAGNPVHTLIQLLDVLVIGLNQYRQLSYLLPQPGRPGYKPGDWGERAKVFWNEYARLKIAIFPASDIAPQHTAAALADRVVADFARHGQLQAEPIIRDAQYLLGELGWCRPRLAHPYADADSTAAFDREGELIPRYSHVRDNLLAALSRTGRDVPDSVRRRAGKAFRSLLTDAETPIPIETLLGWVSETDAYPPAQPHSPKPATPPEFIFAQSGNGYLIRGFGEEGHLSALKGLAVLAQLLTKPNVPVLMIDLIDPTGQRPREGRSKQDSLDHSSLTQLKSEAARFRQEVDDAKDEVEREDSQQHLDRVIEQIRSATNVRGDSRDLNNPIDKLRPQIAGLLKTVWEKFRDAAKPMTKLASHFENNIRAAGSAYVYDPPLPAPDWTQDVSP